jgi:predicted RNase H-like nuclease (RuvC/YqgF family)
MSDIGEAILTAIGEVKGTVQALDGRITGLDRDIATLKTDLTAVKVDLVALRTDVGPMRAHLDGMPMLARNLTVTQQEVRALKAAFNDFALTNPTAGEIEALHTDVNRVQAENTELATRVTTLERLVRELSERH